MQIFLHQAGLLVVANASVTTSWVRRARTPAGECSAGQLQIPDGVPGQHLRLNQR